jgi:hypothetical protein
MLTALLRKREMSIDLQIKVKKYFEYMHAEQMEDNEAGNMLMQ